MIFFIVSSADVLSADCVTDDVEENEAEEVESPSRKCPRIDPSDNAEDPLPSLQVHFVAAAFIWRLLASFRLSVSGTRFLSMCHPY